MAIAQRMGAEIVKALAVLALVLFAVGISPAARADAAPAVPAYAGLADADLATVYCGGIPTDHQAHGPCHACRANPAILPPRPCEALPAYGTIMRIGHAVEIVGDVKFAPVRTGQPRAPPVSLQA